MKRSQNLDNPLKIAGLFAGIGGFESGLHHAGHETSLLCEIDEPACSVLEERFPGIPLHRDVTQLRDVGPADAIVAGFPCQDLSQAGKTEGIDGAKSSLVSHVFRLLDARRVPWVVLENVSFMLHLARGRALDLIVSEFERRGYKWAYRVLDSLAFGVPQRRERVYFVASLVDDPRRVLFRGDEPPSVDRAPSAETAFGFYWTEGSRGLGWAVDSIPTLKGGSTIGIPSPPAIWLADGRIVQPDIRDAERLQGFEADWTKPAELVARSTHRWKLVGNAVTVPVTEWLGRGLITRDGDTEATGRPLPQGRPWPRAAWNVGEGRFAAALSSWPTCKARLPLAEFLHFPPKLLSERATHGFLSRFEASTLAKPAGFVDALKAHLAKMRQETDHVPGRHRVAVG